MYLLGGLTTCHIFGIQLNTFLDLLHYPLEKCILLLGQSRVPFYKPRFIHINRTLQGLTINDDFDAVFCRASCVTCFAGVIPFLLFFYAP